MPVIELGQASRTNQHSCAEFFTIHELRQVYEAMWGTRLDHWNFHRKITGTRKFVAPTGERTTHNGGRPATLYQVGTARLLHPPIAETG